MTSSHCTETKNNAFNLLRYVLPNPSSSTTASENPWNVTDLPNMVTQLRYGYHEWYNSSNKTILNGTFPYYATVGYIGNYGSNQNFKQYSYIQEPKFVSNVTNWNKIGLKMPSAVETYINKNSLTSQLLTLNDSTKALSLAAGVPIVEIEKKQKITIKGEFRKNCSYTYDASTKTSTLNEGSLDNTTAYVVYAQYVPFDISKMPENESNLIDISTDINHPIKDSANTGKLSKCRIVRNGKIDIQFTNNDTKDKVIFLKWEKLSNWSTIGTTRATGSGTNTDVHKTNTTTGETVAAPTWTYFGGGYAKFDNSFRWESIS